MGYDQLFKRILEGLLQEFLETFFPEQAARLDFRTLRFVDKEVFVNVPEGEVRRADLVAELKTRDGEPELVLVHIEVQARPEASFPRRMFQYFAVLRLHYQLPVFPIVVYLRRGSDDRIEEYRENLFGLELLRFRYHCLALARLAAEEYVGMGALGAAFSALMDRGGSPDVVRLRVSMIEQVVGSGLDDALKHLLVDVIETFFELSGSDAEEYRRIVSRKEYRAVEEVELTWSEKLMEKGREEGLRRTLLRLLISKFGELSRESRQKLEAMSVSELDSILERVLTAKALDELGLGDSNPSRG